MALRPAAKVASTKAVGSSKSSATSFLIRDEAGPQGSGLRLSDATMEWSPSGECIFSRLTQSDRLEATRSYGRACTNLQHSRRFIETAATLQIAYRP
jgi:hypothetical protein